MYSSDQRIVMTLDAGGTNFVFSAIQSNHEIIDPIRYPAAADNLEECLQTLEKGFREVLSQLPEKPAAISFAFPGPADYPNGIIGDLPNFPSFRGGVPLGPFLEELFNIPVYINNDGDLFAYGEAIAGILPAINQKLEAAGSVRRFKNLVGVTLGTGFGAGVVVNNQLLIGDNSDGGNVWCMRNKKYPRFIVEESVSIRAVQRVYRERSGSTETLTPKHIFEIAEGIQPGDREAAIQSFAELGEMAAEAIMNALNLIDGLVVIGGGLSGAKKYIIPSILKYMNEEMETFNGDRFPRTSVKVIDLESNFDELLAAKTYRLPIPKSEKYVTYTPEKITGIHTSELGASLAVSLGAYAFALSSLDTN